MRMVASGLPERLPERLFECGWGTVGCVSSPGVLLSLSDVLLPSPCSEDGVGASAAVVAAGSAASGEVTAEGMTVSWLDLGLAGSASTTE